MALEYDPSSTATTLPPLDNQPNLPTGNQTWQSAFMVLPTGQLLCSAQTNTIFIYTPDPSETPDPAWKPANITVPSTMVLNHSYTLSGTQINGLSQAVSYGDDAGMATNYPIVRLTNPATGQVVYARSYDFNTMGIATGTAVPDDLQSCTIDIPGTLATGTWNLAVIANGIASDPVPVQIAAQDCYFIVDNSTFSIGEIDTYVDGAPPAPAIFDPAFYVVAEGYNALEIGFGTSHLIQPSVPSPFTGHLEIAFTGTVIPEDSHASFHHTAAVHVPVHHDVPGRHHVRGVDLHGHARRHLHRSRHDRHEHCHDHPDEKPQSVHPSRRSDPDTVRNPGT